MENPADFGPVERELKPSGIISISHKLETTRFTPSASNRVKTLGSANDLGTYRTYPGQLLATTGNGRVFGNVNGYNADMDYQFSGVQMVQTPDDPDRNPISVQIGGIANVKNKTTSDEAVHCNDYFEIVMPPPDHDGIALGPLHSLAKPFLLQKVDFTFHNPCLQILDVIKQNLNTSGDNIQACLTNITAIGRLPRTDENYDIETKLKIVEDSVNVHYSENSHTENADPDKVHLVNLILLLLSEIFNDCSQGPNQNNIDKVRNFLAILSRILERTKSDAMNLNRRIVGKSVRSTEPGQDLSLLLS